MRPILFTVPGLDWPLAAYGFFIGVALVVGWLLSLSLARRDGLPVELLGTSYVLTAAVGLFGARAGWMVQNPDRWDSWGVLFSLQADGLAPFFGVTVGLLVSAAHVGRRRVAPLAWWDAAAPAFAVGVVLERIGALLAGAGHGRYAPDLAFAIRYPQGSPPYVAHARELSQLMPRDAPFSLPVHPVPVYGAVLGVVGLVLCLVLRSRRRFVGQVFLAFSIVLLLGRSFLEDPFRADAASPMFGPLNPGQLAGLVLALALTATYYARWRRAEVSRTRGKTDG
jgi:phosphatidylglycerol---prolipoprotein diacylglyceryl transferase